MWLVTCGAYKLHIHNLSMIQLNFTRSCNTKLVVIKFVSSTDFFSSISEVSTERNVGDPQDVICIVASTSGLDDADSVTTSWTGPNGVITNDNRLTINTTIENNIYTSILHFDYIVESDEGIYTCNVTTIDHNVSLSTSLTNLISKLCIQYMYIIICDPA